MKNVWKVDDWCLHDYKIKQIKRMGNGGHVVEVSDGSFNMGAGGDGFDDRIFPLTLKGKVIAGSFDYYYRSIQDSEKGMNLNWPDIHRYFETSWCRCMLCLQIEDEKEREIAIKEEFEKIKEFVKETKEKIEKVREIRVGGIPLMR